MALNGQGSKERRSGGSDLRPSRPGRELLGHVRTGTARRDPDEACLPAGVEDRNDGLPVSQRRRALLRPLLVHAALSTQDERRGRSEEHTSELQSLMRISYAVFCLKKKKEPEPNRIVKQ